MSDTRSTVFGVLDDENEDHMQNEGENGPSSGSRRGGEADGGSSSSGGGGGGGDDATMASSGGADGQADEGWQVTTKTRRLAPSHTLSHKDLGADSPRSKATSQELAASKKKGVWHVQNCCRDFVDCVALLRRFLAPPLHPPNPHPQLFPTP